MEDNILEVRNLKARYYVEEGEIKAVDKCSFNVSKGETLGIAGESGCGKSSLALSVMGLIKPPGTVEGEVIFKGNNLLTRSPEQMRKIRGKEISMIFQDPMTYLNPIMTLGEQISRIMRTHLSLNEKEARTRTIELMTEVGIPDPEKRFDNYPHQFSGGMRQRILIAMAICCNPMILIADEPTTALDVTTETQIFEVLKNLQKEYGMTLILITHDLGLIADTCERVMIMYAGRIVEKSIVPDLYENPLHPYTKGLLSSIPRIAGQEAERLPVIEGEVPDLITLPSGCHFRTRCSEAIGDCADIDPDLYELDAQREAACIVRAQEYGRRIASLGKVHTRP
jgi:oligopeptide/dipeptide ABC transporter ATP-binding protein